MMTELLDWKIKHKDEEPYSKNYINYCRELALRFDKKDQIVRAGLLQELWPCVPVHYRAEVFADISNWEYVG